MLGWVIEIHIRVSNCVPVVPQTPLFDIKGNQLIVMTTSAAAVPNSCPYKVVPSPPAITAGGGVVCVVISTAW